jgi:hypothetical protein
LLHRRRREQPPPHAVDEQITRHGSNLKAKAP